MAEMTAQLVADALMMAIWRRGRPGALLHHSDSLGQHTTSFLRATFSERMPRRKK